MDDLEALIGPSSSSTGLVDTFGAAIVQRALELAEGQPPEANLMPYINGALAEASADQPSKDDTAENLRSYIP